MASRGPFENNATAHHEAAHAVAAVVLGIPGKIKRVTIEDDGETEGRVVFVDPDGRPTNEPDARKWILQNLVGPQSEAKIRYGVEDPPGAKCDYERAAWAALKFSFAADADFPNVAAWDTDYWDSGWKAKAKAFNEQHWPAIEAVAKALLQKVTLEGDEVEAIVGEIEPTALGASSAT